MVVTMPEPDDLREEATRDVNSFFDRFLRDKLPSYYQPVRDKINPTQLSDYKKLNYNELKDIYLDEIDRVDNLVKNVGISQSDLIDRQGGILSRFENLNDAKDALLVDELQRLDNQNTLSRMADYESVRYLNGLPLAPIALLSSGIGSGIAGLDPLQSLATGIASAAAIPVTDAVLNVNPSLRKYKTTTGVRPAAAALTGILTALGFKVLSPQQDQELLNQGMQYAQQQNGGTVQ